jgi:hypothetical protein
MFHRCLLPPSSGWWVRRLRKAVGKQEMAGPVEWRGRGDRNIALMMEASEMSANPARLQGVISQKAVILLLVAVRTWNHTSVCFPAYERGNAVRVPATTLAILTGFSWLPEFQPGSSGVAVCRKTNCRRFFPNVPHSHLITHADNRPTVGNATDTAVRLTQISNKSTRISINDFHFFFAVMLYPYRPDVLSNDVRRGNTVFYNCCYH